MNNVSFASLRNLNFHVEGKLINPENDFDKMNVHHSSPTYTATNITYPPKHEFGKVGKETLEEKMEFGKVDPNEILGRSMVYFSPEALTLDNENCNSSGSIQNKLEVYKNLDEKYSQKEIRKILKQVKSYILSGSEYSIFLLENGTLVIDNKTCKDDTIAILPDGSAYRNGEVQIAPEGAYLDIINEAKKRSVDV